MDVISADIQNLAQAILNVQFRSLDRANGGDVAGFLSMQSGSAIDFLSGASLTSETGSTVLLKGSAPIPVSFEYARVFIDLNNLGTLEQAGNATFGVGSIVDITGHAILRKSLALTSAGRIKLRISELAGTGATNANSNTFDCFTYVGLTADRVFTLTSTGAEIGDVVRISLVPLGTNAFKVDVQNDVANPLITLHAPSVGPFMWADFQFITTSGNHWALVAYGP
jgi:hypothetical protein